MDSECEDVNELVQSHFHENEDASDDVSDDASGDASALEEGVIEFVGVEDWELEYFVGLLHEIHC